MFLCFLFFPSLPFCPSYYFSLCFFTSQSLNCTHLLRCAAHKHKQLCPVTAWVRGGFSRPSGKGSSVYVLCTEPREHNVFVWSPGREDRWPGWPRTCWCAKCLCAFSLASPDGVATGEHWTGSPNKSIDQIGEKCLARVCSGSPDNFWTFSDIFWHFWDIV